MTDSSFQPEPADLTQAQQLLLALLSNATTTNLPTAELPGEPTEHGIGELAALQALAPYIAAGSARLGNATALAHMDPPTPWITWVISQWNAALNHNLLHPELAASARAIDAQVVNWLAAQFGMTGGHMTPGSTVANLTGLWAARETRGITQVFASSEAHVSVAKACNLLGLTLHQIPAGDGQRLNPNALASLAPQDLAKSALVLTAGTTSTGAIDDLTPATDHPGRAAWVHVDAAWAGPLALSPEHRVRLHNIECADSIAVSAHKWLFQPKESGFVLFRNVGGAHSALSFGGPYLQAPNIGLLGSHGGNAIALYAMLLAWGNAGLVERIERCMSTATQLGEWLGNHSEVAHCLPNQSGVIAWVPKSQTVAEVAARLPPGIASTTTVDGQPLLRHVAANPNANLKLITEAIDRALLTG